MQQYSNGLANAAANGNYYPPQQQPSVAFGGQWNADGPAKPLNAGQWNGQNHLKNQFNQQRAPWNSQNGQPWQKQQQQGQQWNGQSPQQQQQQQRAVGNNFKGFAFKQPMGGRLPHLQNSFVKQGGGPLDVAEQVLITVSRFYNLNSFPKGTHIRIFGMN